MRRRGIRASQLLPAPTIPEVPRCCARIGAGSTPTPSHRSRSEAIASASRSRAPVSQPLYSRRSSSVTRGAAGACVNIVALGEHPPRLLRITFRLPGHVGDLLDRPQVLLWMSVTVQTPAHRKRRCLLDSRHLVDAPVATHATNAFV